MYSTVKMQSLRDPELGLEEIISLTKTIFINDSERLSVPKRSQELYRKSRDDSSREPTMNSRESTMTTVITGHNCKRPGYKKKACNRLNKKSDTLSNAESGKKKWCSYHHSNDYLNGPCYQQQSESANLDRKKRWCTYHNRASHSNAK